MPNNAHVAIVGNLIKDPVKTTYNNSPVVSFTVAVSTTMRSEDGQWLPNFYNVSVWGQTGENLMEKIEKGTQVYVTGALMLQKYEKNGVEGQSLQIRASAVTPLSRLKGGQYNNNNHGNYNRRSNNNNNNDEDAVMDTGDSVRPF
jgi:single-strand DNA-binding protein